MVLVIKKEDYILISENGKKLIIDKNDKIFNEINNLSKEEIKEWYKNK